MIKFDNDYSQSAHPAIIEAISNDTENSYTGYGLDEVCSEAANLIREKIACPNADVHFLAGGTQTNQLAIDIALKSFEGVIAADTGHINVHETGAIEYTGHKVIALPGKDGKLCADQIINNGELKLSEPSPGHVVEANMVYISQPTELGTLYSKEELESIYDACKKYGFYLYIDGARLSYALGSPINDVGLEDLAKYCDMFYIGGTKCGLLFGEALVILNDKLKPHFFSYQKQHGALLAKGWLLGIQFQTLLRNNLYVELAKPAVEMALKLKQAFIRKGIDLYINSPTNQQFIILNNDQAAKLSKKYIFSEICSIDENHKCFRFCTSWYTKKYNVDELISDIAKL